MPVSSNRADVLAAVNNFWIDATELNADVLVIATTRPQGYNEDYSPGLYTHRWLVPLSNSRAVHYGDRLAQVRYGNDRDRFQKVAARLARALESEATARLMRSPLQVTIMTTLVDRIGQPPQERWRLFKEYYSVIYQRETERPIAAATILRDYKPDIDAIHSQVGLLLQVASDRPGRTEARLSSDSFAQLVEERLVQEGHEGYQLAALKQQFIQAATQRLVFLVGLEADRVGFEIRSLQEFMAAEGLMDANDQLVQERLREIAPASSWRNVFLFAAGKCFAERQYLRDTIHTICAEMNENPEDQLARATLAGSQLALDLLEDGPARRQPKYSESLARVALRLLDLPPDRYHTRLADLYDEKLKAVYKEELEMRITASSLLRRSAAWNCLVTLVEAKVHWADQLKQRYWPQGKDEQKNLLRIALDNRDGDRFAQELASLLLQLEPREVYSSFSLRRLRSVVPEVMSDTIGLLGDEFRHMHRVPLRLSNTQGDMFRLGFVPVEPVELVREGAFDYLMDYPNPNDGWLPFIAAARFMEKPSSDRLAHELRNIAQSPRSSFFGCSGLPWPMAACLSGKLNRGNLESLAQRAQEGKLGDYDDWRSAETRWLHGGVTVEDLFAAGDEHWPFDADIADRGFAFVGSMSLTLDPDIEALIWELHDIYGALPQSQIRSEVARWVLFASEVYGKHYGKTQMNLDYGQLQALARDAGWEPSLYSVFALGLLDAPCDKDWLDFLDNLGRQHALRRLGESAICEAFSETMLKVLSKAFLDNPSALGILRLLSLFAPLEETPSLPLLDPREYLDPEIQKAVIVLWLVHKHHHQGDAMSLAQLTVELADDDPQFIDKVISVIGKGNTFTEDYLVELPTSLSDAQWAQAKDIVRVLNELLGSHTSNFADHVVWSDLGLPQGLHRLLDQR